MGRAAHLSFTPVNGLEEQKDYERCAGEERAERNRSLARCGTLAEENHGRDDARGERPEEKRRSDGPAEQRTDQEAELHVTHAQAGGINEGDHEEEESPAEAGGE